MHCLLAGLLIILLIYFIGRLQYIIGAEKLNGKFVFYIEEVVREEKLTFPIIEYIVDDSVYQFRAKENTEYILNECVPVLLENKDPDTPLLFTIGSFWLYPLFYFILPLLLWVSFVMSYISKNEWVELGAKFPFFKKSKK